MAMGTVMEKGGPSRQGEGSSPSEEAYQMSMGKIMVADDDQNICELLRLYLEKEGYTI